MSFLWLDLRKRPQNTRRWYFRRIFFLMVLMICKGFISQFLRLRFYRKPLIFMKTAELFRNHLKIVWSKPEKSGSSLLWLLFLKKYEVLQCIKFISSFIWFCPHYRVDQKSFHDIKLPPKIEFQVFFSIRKKFLKAKILNV